MIVGKRQQMEGDIKVSIVSQRVLLADLGEDLQPVDFQCAKMARKGPKKPILSWLTKLTPFTVWFVSDETMTQNGVKSKNKIGCMHRIKQAF
jgi:hypothetical protein